MRLYYIIEYPHIVGYPFYCAYPLTSQTSENTCFADKMCFFPVNPFFNHSLLLCVCIFMLPLVSLNYILYVCTSEVGVLMCWSFALVCAKDFSFLFYFKKMTMEQMSSYFGRQVGSVVLFIYYTSQLLFHTRLILGSCEVLCMWVCVPYPAIYLAYGTVVTK